jgi:hypothetical protein
MAGVLVIQGLITSNFTFCISTCRGDSQKGHASSARPGTLRWGGRTLVDSALSKCMVDLSFFILLPNLASWSALAPRPSMLLQRREVIVLVMTRAYTGQCDSWSIDGAKKASKSPLRCTALAAPPTPLLLAAPSPSRCQRRLVAASAPAQTSSARARPQRYRTFIDYSEL